MSGARPLTISADSTRANSHAGPLSTEIGGDPATIAAPSADEIASAEVL
jgi:hypothetical protein